MTQQIPMFNSSFYWLRKMVRKHRPAWALFVQRSEQIAAVSIRGTHVEQWLGMMVWPQFCLVVAIQRQSNRGIMLKSFLEVMPLGWRWIGLIGCSSSWILSVCWRVSAILGSSNSQQFNHLSLSQTFGFNFQHMFHVSICFPIRNSRFIRNKVCFFIPTVALSAYFYSVFQRSK